mgnify:FL=1
MVNDSAPFCTTAMDLDHASEQGCAALYKKYVAHFISDLVARLDYESRCMA